MRAAEGPAAAGGLVAAEAPAVAEGPPAGRVVAFIDIGTNAIRLLVVRVVPGHIHTVITEQREPARLGEGEFPDRLLQPGPMEQAILVCRKFVELARGHGAQEIVAVATSATREALNAEEFLHRLRVEAGLHVRVISGREEARLIYAGLSNFLHLGQQKAVFVDIGGGSTEVIVGGQRRYEFLDTIGVGAVRLTSLMFSPTDVGPISPRRYEQMRQYARHAAVHTIYQVGRHHAELLVGTAGTIRNLAAVAASSRRIPAPEDGEVLTRAELRRVATMLRRLPLEERRKVSGLNPDRADIIVSGAAILEVLMEGMGFDTMRVMPVGGLREGLLMDYLAQGSHDLHWLSVRERSVLHLGRACHFDEPHARNAQRLALELFDTAREAGIHRYGEWEREILGYAALLHDIGAFLSYGNHHVHSFYLIKNADLLGFHQAEITMMALIALFHRRGLPGTGAARLRRAGQRRPEPGEVLELDGASYREPGPQPPERGKARLHPPVAAQGTPAAHVCGRRCPAGALGPPLPGEGGPEDPGPPPRGGGGAGGRPWAPRDPHASSRAHRGRPAMTAQ